MSSIVTGMLGHIYNLWLGYIVCCEWLSKIDLYRAKIYVFRLPVSEN